MLIIMMVFRQRGVGGWVDLGRICSLEEVSFESRFKKWKESPNYRDPGGESFIDAGQSN